MRLARVPGSFPYGSAPFVLLIAALAASAWLLMHPIPEEEGNLSFWVFAKTHYNAYLKNIPSFEEKHPGVKVEIQLVHGEAVTRRLQAAFWADLDVPDLVEVEIGFAGTFFRGPQEEIGFVDLLPYLEADGLYDRIVQTRFAPYMNRGAIYGLPHDVHPVMLAYRRDIFDREGVDVSAIETWDDFVEIGRRLTIQDQRYMIELHDTHHGNFEVLLFQRGGGYFDREGNLTMDDETAVQTMLWYVPLVAGPDRIANTLGGGQVLTKAIEEGYLLCLFCPDWRSKFFEVDVPRMSGKMAVMPLPAVEPGGRRTSTWGGTMIGITKKCRQKKLAWELAKHLYLDPVERAETFVETNILPPVKDAWDMPEYSVPDDYWSDQAIGRMYIELAEDVPPQYTSPFIFTAKGKMSEALSACTSYYNKNQDDGFEEFARATLKNAADEVRVYMSRNRF